MPKILLQLLEASWNDITKATVINCFYKAKIFMENQTDPAANRDDPFKDLQEHLSELLQYMYVICTLLTGKTNKQIKQSLNWLIYL